MILPAFCSQWQQHASRVCVPPCVFNSPARVIAPAIPWLLEPVLVFPMLLSHPPPIPLHTLNSAHPTHSVYHSIAVPRPSLSSPTPSNNRQRTTNTLQGSCFFDKVDGCRWFGSLGGCARLGMCVCVSVLSVGAHSGFVQHLEMLSIPLSSVRWHVTRQASTSG